MTHKEVRKQLEASGVTKLDRLFGRRRRHNKDRQEDGYEPTKEELRKARQRLERLLGDKTAHGPGMFRVTRIHAWALAILELTGLLMEHDPYQRKAGKLFSDDKVGE